MVAHDRSDIFVTLFYSQLAGFAFAAAFARRKPLREIGADVGRARDSIFLSIAGTAVLIALVASLLVDKWLIDILDTVLI